MEATQPNLKTLGEIYQSGETEDFSLVLGGPLFPLLRKTHLEGGALELLHRRIIASVVITRFPLLIFSMLGAVGRGLGRTSFFHDIVVREMRTVTFGLQDVSRLGIATAGPLSPLLLTIFSFEELLIRIFKIVF